MILIGLRNFGEKYKKTRHNAGAIVLDFLAKDQDRTFVTDKYVDADRCGEMYLPNTFMNLSGESVQKIVKKEGIDTKDLYVFFDDVTISVGQYKISVGEGASSHNGIRSIIENLGGANDFKRVRIGVGMNLADGKLYTPREDKLSDFVLGNLNNLEIAQIQSISKKVLIELNLH